MIEIYQIEGNLSIKKTNLIATIFKLIRLLQIIIKRQNTNYIFY